MSVTPEGPWSVAAVAEDVSLQFTGAEMLNALGYALTEREQFEATPTHRAQVTALLADHAISSSGDIPASLRS
jgi:hypothetical protein